jgi:hypothetical protein
MLVRLLTYQRSGLLAMGGGSVGKPAECPWRAVGLSFVADLSQSKMCRRSCGWKSEAPFVVTMRDGMTYER